MGVPPLHHHLPPRPENLIADGKLAQGLSTRELETATPPAGTSGQGGRG
jgi:hypothetical protein